MNRQILLNMFFSFFILSLILLTIDRIWKGSISLFINPMLILIFGISLLIYYLNLRNKSSIPTETNNKYCLYVVTVIILASIIRMYNLGNQPPWIDEIISMSVARGIVEGGIPYLPSGILYLRDVFYHYILAVVFKIFGENNFIARVPSLIFSVGTLIVIYLLGRKIRNKDLGLISIMLLSFLTLEIAWSRQARMYQQFQFFYLLSILLFFNLKGEFNTKNLMLFVISLSFSLLSHFSSLILLISLTIQLIIFESYKYKDIINYYRKKQKKILIALLIIGLFLFIYILTNNFYLPIHNFLSLKVDNSLQYVKLLRTNIPYLLLASILAIPMYLRGYKRVFLLLNVILFILLTFYKWEGVWIRYIYAILPILVLFAAETIYTIYTTVITYLKNKINFKDKYKIFLICMIFTIIIFSDIMNKENKEFTLTLKEKYNLQEPQTNFEIAYNYIAKNIKDGEVVVSVTTGLLPAHYYLGDNFYTKRNYDLSYKFPKTSSNYLAKEINNVWYEGYTNSEVITNYKYLLKIIRSSKGTWFVLDHQKVNHIDKETKVILGRGKKINEASDETIEVYYISSGNYE